MMFFLGMTRPASTILSVQRENILREQYFNDILIQMTEMAQDLRIKLSSGDVDSIGPMLHQGWLLKQKMAESISNDTISHYYNVAIQNGAVGGKLLGAGGGGFLLLYVYPDAQKRVRRSLRDLQELKFQLDNTGTKIIYHSDI
jgi:D-glycero-alpha-D-manno-heptose-7-phosphate kinase